MFEGLPYNYFNCIHADVPWSYEDWSEAGEGRNAKRHYPCMPDHEIARLPVLAHAASDCHLFFWVTGPMLVAGRHVRIMRSWGFEPSALAFVWVKLNDRWHPRWMGFLDDAITFMGLGHTIRQSVEVCLLGRRGSPMRLSKRVRQVIFAPLREHSRKPESVYERIEAYCPGPRLDLFGRQSRSGWTVTGNEKNKFDPVRTFRAKVGHRKGAESQFVINRK
jgi:N6-adenosine-specific RNA methylase IME4